MKLPFFFVLCTFRRLSVDFAFTIVLAVQYFNLVEIHFFRRKVGIMGRKTA